MMNQLGSGSGYTGGSYSSSVGMRNSNIQNLRVGADASPPRRDPPGQRSIHIYIPKKSDPSLRLNSLQQLNQTFLDIRDRQILAGNGFYYTGYNDRLKCSGCGHELENLRVSHQASDVTQWHSNQCEFLKSAVSHQAQHAAGSPVSDSRTPILNQHFTRGFSANNPLSSRQHNPHNIQRQSGIASTAQQAYTGSQQASHRKKYPTIELATIVSPYHEQTVKNSDLRKENDRRETFTKGGWSNEYTNWQLLACKGFFYLGNRDRVQCFSCGTVLRNFLWNDTEESIDGVHRREVSNCPMLCGTDDRNMPLNPVFTSTHSGIAQQPSSSTQHGVGISEMQTLRMQLIQKFDAQEVKSVWSDIRKEAAAECILVRGEQHLIEQDVLNKLKTSSGEHFVGVLAFELSGDFCINLSKHCNYHRSDNTTPAIPTRSANSSPTEVSSLLSSFTLGDDCNEISLPEDLPESLVEQARAVSRGLKCELCDKKVDIMLLPCTHLSLCSWCKPVVGYCPKPLANRTCEEEITGFRYLDGTG